MECRDSSARCAFDALVKSVAATTVSAQCECASNFSFSHIILSLAVQRNVQCAYNLVFRFKLCVKSRTGANVHMTFEAAKCEVYTVHTETKRDNKTKSNKKYVWTAKFEQTVLFARVCVSLCALQLRLCHGSKQVNSKHIHNFRLIITKTHTQQQHSERWNKSDRECEVRARKKEQFCRIVRNENGAPNDLKCSISSHTIFLLFDAMQSLLSLEMCAENVMSWCWN